MTVVDAAFARLPRRAEDSHKGDFGRALLFCGTVGYTGAARLAAEGCIRCGPGLVTLCVPEKIYPVAASACLPEIIVRPLPCDAEGRFSLSALPAMETMLETADACLIGPGLGVSEELETLVSRLWETCRAPLVVDAQGLNALAGHIHIQDCPRVLTPHAGEFARLFPELSGLSKAAAAARAAEETGAVLVYKGSGTVTAGASGLYRNTSGNPGMAVGGSGDVLAGMLCGLLAQKSLRQRFETVEALCAAGVFWHGLAGDLAAGARGQYGMTPSDIVEQLPRALQSCTE